MSELVRFGVAMDRQLLAEFDERITKRGYENRSEALRDLVRADLTKAAWEGGESVTGTLTVVLSRRQRAEVARVFDENAALVVATLGVDLDGDRVINVVLVRGLAGRLNALAGRLAGLRGVLNAELTIASVDGRVEVDPDGRMDAEAADPRADARVEAAAAKHRRSPPSAGK